MYKIWKFEHDVLLMVDIRHEKHFIEKKEFFVSIDMTWHGENFCFRKCNYFGLSKCLWKWSKEQYVSKQQQQQQKHAKMLKIFAWTHYKNRYGISAWKQFLTVLCKRRCHMISSIFITQSGSCREKERMKNIIFVVLPVAKKFVLTTNMIKIVFLLMKNVLSIVA